MYAVTVPDLIYHLVVSDRVTLCKRVSLNPLDKRRRTEDWRTVDAEPANRVCVLCSKCAELSGDRREFSERIIYPAVSVQISIES